MSMFAGLSNQITGFVSQKMGKGEGEAGGETEVPVEGGEAGEAVEGEAAAGGAMGFAQGLMMKAAMAKEGLKEKASGLNAGNLTGFRGGGEEVQVGEDGLPIQPELDENGLPVEGEAPPAGAMGFAAGLMMKAHAAAEGVKEKASGINTGNIQGIGMPTAMAGGVMGQVQGIIPGMRKEEEVPEPAPPQEEYQEYQEEQQYAE